jgi:hypothetical protein
LSVRVFKKTVYETNHFNVEKSLLRVNFQQTARLLLLDTFASSDPELTALFRELSTQCPSLFQTMLPRSEYTSLVKRKRMNFRLREIQGIRVPQ